VVHCDVDVIDRELKLLAVVTASIRPTRRHTNRDLCRELGWDRTPLSHLVRRTGGRGLVSRGAVPDDARGSVVEITPDSRRAIEDAALHTRTPSAGTSSTFSMIKRSPQ
jgi:DNA-binding MarR family transcriptional regulator